MIVYGKKVIDTQTILQAMQKKIAQNVRIQRLQDYYNGNHDICLRYYDDPTKPNNKIVVNYCKDIADFMTAYLVGVPVKLDVPEPVKKALLANDEDAEQQDVVHDMVVSGFACELAYTDEHGDVRYNNINPIECIVFMDDDLRSDITAFVRMVKQEDGGYLVTLYNSETKQDFMVDEACGQIKAVSEAEPHFFGEVPIAFYPNGENMQGQFEQAIPMQDALNKVMSDSVNDFEGFVDAYLVLEGMQGTTEEDISEMKKNRVLLTDADSKAYWLTKSVNNDHVQQLLENLRSSILEMGNIPDMRTMDGGYTADLSGAAIRMRLIKTEIQASRMERIVTRGIQRKIKLLYNILSLTDSGLEYAEVVPEFTRNFLLTAGEEYELDGGDRYSVGND